MVYFTFSSTFLNEIGHMSNATDGIQVFYYYSSRLH